LGVGVRDGVSFSFNSAGKFTLKEIKAQSMVRALRIKEV
jgi:hypothetical protein